MTSKEKGSEWATTGGYVKSGQTSREAIIPEVKEELGIDIGSDDIKMIDSSIFGFVFFNVYYLNKDIEVESLVLQKEEVEYVSGYLPSKLKI